MSRFHGGNYLPRPVSGAAVTGQMMCNMGLRYILPYTTSGVTYRPSFPPCGGLLLSSFYMTTMASQGSGASRGLGHTLFYWRSGIATQCAVLGNPLVPHSIEVHH